MPLARAAEAAGRLFGRYRLVERIGSGGMAIVYRAIADGPEGFARAFVIKRVRPELSKDPEFAKMLAAEARLSALLHHGNIVQVFELGQVGDEYYLAMEHVDGIDLVKLLNRCNKLGRPLPVGLTCYLIGELAAALAYAHDLSDGEGRALGIVHRDVSPSNVMITPGGNVKLLDFGIAKATDSARDEQTRTGKLKGKVSYLSPEQAEGAEIDRRADVFGLGILFWECLTLRRLFRAGGDLATLRLVREAKVPPPSSVAAQVPAELDAIALKMLARDPADRYAGCAEIVAALRPVIHRLGGDAPTLGRFVADLGPFEKAEQGTADDWPALPSTGGGHSLLKPPRVYWLAGAAAGAIALVTSVALLARGPSHERPAATAPATVSAPAPAPKPAAPPAAQPPATQQVTIRSEPPGATVTVDGRARGVTPALLALALPAQVEVTLAGYRPAREVVSRPGELKLKLVRARAGARPAAKKGGKFHLGLD